MDLNNNQTTRSSIFSNFTPITHKIFEQEKNYLENKPYYEFESNHKKYPTSTPQQIKLERNNQYGIIHYDPALTPITQSYFEQLIHNQEKIETEIAKEHNKLESKLSDILKKISDEKKLVKLVLEELKDKKNQKSKFRIKKSLRLINNKFVFIEKPEPKIKPEILEKYLKEYKKIKINRELRVF